MRIPSFSLPLCVLCLPLFSPLSASADVDAPGDVDKPGVTISGEDSLVIGVRERAEGAERGWHGALGMGWDVNTGDTDTRDYSGSFLLKKIGATWLHQIKAEAQRSEENGIIGEDFYTIRGKTQHFVTHSRYYLGDARHEVDQFSGNDYETSVFLGHGWRVVERDTVGLDLELAYGVHRAKSTLTQIIHDEGILRTAGALFWKLSPSSTIVEELAVETSHDDIRTESYSEIKLKVAGGFSMKLTFLIQHDNEVPEGIQTVNTRSTGELVYDF